MTFTLLGMLAGSPAYAGIDPRIRASRATRQRFPRLRGDRPDLASLTAAEAEVPPPTRG